MSTNWLEHTPRHDADLQAGILAEWGRVPDIDDPRVASAIRQACRLARELEQARAESARARDLLARIVSATGSETPADAVAVAVAVVTAARGGR